MNLAADVKAKLLDLLEIAAFNYSYMFSSSYNEGFRDGVERACGLEGLAKEEIEAAKQKGRERAANESKFDEEYR